MFSINTEKGLNVVGEYALSICKYNDPALDIYNFDLSPYEMDFLLAYKLGDNELILDEKKKQELISQQNTQLNKIKIQELKQMLFDTDYVACKIAEGSATKEEYIDIINKRESWRKQIRELENQESI